MKRFVLILLLLIVGAAAWAQTTYDETPFLPWSPETAAQGGSFTANAKGFNALFYNPAAFGRDKGSLTIVTTTPWLYLPLAEDSLTTTLDAVTAISDDVTGSIGALNEYLTGNGLGFGMMTGVGYVGRNLGLGLVGILDSFAYGPNTLGVQADVNLTLGFVGGLGFPIHLGGMTLFVGGAVRPMYRVSVKDIGMGEFMDLLAGAGTGSDSNTTALHGVGLGIDAGVIAELGFLSLGLTVKDLFGTKFHYSTSTLDDVLGALEAGQLPEGDPVPEEDQYIVPMSVNFGVAIDPDLGGLSFLFDPIVHAQYTLPLGAVEETSFWKGMHVGAEVAFFRFIKVRGGINQGYFTLGAGLHLLFLDINLALFSRESGSYAGAHQTQGLAAEVAIRF